MKNKSWKQKSNDEVEYNVFSPKDRINNQIIDLFNGICSRWEEYKIDRENTQLQAKLYQLINLNYLWLKDSIVNLGGNDFKDLAVSMKEFYDEDFKDINNFHQKISKIILELSTFLHQANYISGEFTRKTLDYSRICEEYEQEIE